MKGLTILNRQSLAFKGAVSVVWHLQVVDSLFGRWYMGHGIDMLDLVRASAVLAHKAHGSGEDDLAPLAGLHGPRRVRLS